MKNKMAEEMLKLFPDKCKIVRIKLLHTEAVRKYVMRIEEGHNKAAYSKLKFKYQTK